ncbi:S41 family peptidase [uncultured Bacteroides sp.]|uniref:S41 family peptidase n=1 Tax=uncultured Bacteroides sp. TaxID=162156 RepID=UPI0025DB00EC|nr:S41 family peptidase [uncultured Bacteroides sp.]
MNKLLLSAFTLCFAGTVIAQESPLWMRHCALSPDGKDIAFTYKGDIYTVPSSGGRATQVTTNPAFDTEPIWSPDGKQIAFASDRMGSMDVFVVSREGGTPRRLTTHSGSEKPVAYKDNNHILFTANIAPSTEDAGFPSGQFQQIYEVAVTGGRPVMFSSLPMECISINKDGAMLYQDKKGYEDYWRKHQVSPIARDIWMYTPGKTPVYQKQTTFGGEDREPVWAPDGKSFYYLSEEKGSFNVFQHTPGDATSRQITFHTKHPIRFLSIANDGKICYGYDGEIYTLLPNGKPQKVNITILADKNDKDIIRQIRSYGATDIAVSPKGKEVAFIMRGDVYVTSIDYQTTKQITNTPDQERNISFSPDGRTLVYSSERNGLWQLYTSTIVRKEEKQFTYATELKEERLTNSSVASFEPQFSPDGKEIAFLENRTSIRVINLKSKAVRTVMDAQYQYSYSDGDQWFQWSPDSKWILSDYIGIGGWNNKDVVLLKADGKGEMVNLTESGYSDTNAKWVLGGKAMIWNSDRAGYRSHGSWGSERDVYIMFFDVDAYNRFTMSKEDLALLEEAEKAEKEEKAKKEKAEKEKADKKKDAKGKDAKKEDTDKKKEEDVKALTFDLDNRFDRIVRLTVNSSRLGDAVLTPKGDALYYLAAFEGGYDLWVHKLKENSTKILLKGVGGGALIPDKEEKNIFMCTGGQLKKIEIAGSKITPISFEAFFDYRPYEERAYIFDHVYQQVNDKFYVADLQGTDWKGYKTAYERFLPHISNNYDFAEMLSEFLGELNASHTGARYGAGSSALPTASLGVFYDESYNGAGLKIKEILDQSPLTQKKTDVKAGCIIEKVDGKTIENNADYFPLFEGKVGRKVILTVYDPATKKRFEETVKAISYGAQSDLLYKRWVKRCAQKVEELSGGRIAYIHIKGMDSPSFRKMYSELLGRYRNKEAVIIDTRHNGGGWLHDDVVTLLSGKEYQRFVPRGQYIGSDPFNKWLKPSCMLACEDNYSNAHGTPYVYKTLGIGKLIGTPVAGTMTAVWWERQIDPSIVFGIPQVGCMDMDGKYLENQTLQPDILVYNEPAASLKGEDAQLKAAVEHLLKELLKKK